LPLGFYENFPPNIHLTEKYNSTVTSKRLQEKLIQTLQQINKKEFSFEEISNPTIPECKIIFEFGLAEAGDFRYIDEKEVKKTLNVLSKETLQIMDFFCAIRYYKGQEKTPLKFDYYILRTIYNEHKFEIQISPQRGPRYISPKDLAALIINKINEGANKKILKEVEQ
jgi:hypothetical protein